ncbi:monovalent cation:proton antiporter family protein [Rivihabitans pingtungensis]|jgi:CPA2 family monovalent cation:H+ antiporter-2|uniref:Kef-type potassium/proton antiporter (CPA2 family) n=2 Tax=Rivihabitans pingtungensis TaxID=1054498 RepID=A0A318KLD5_9NEIS|nr:monovalent cation:proton antiporter family protein [Rivihabitans pingtungensis]PXX78864.1 Kef-type potassium/proton antiporter (CPA2 family) [Rivihabitans pingtungensis]HNX71413.1 cation:proton antiporter [Rivihabitans pingtungensis]
MHSLAPVVAILLAAVLVVVLCRLLRVPAMLGYLLVGFIVGPGGLQLIADTAQTRFLGEIGIVFLMFTIGLEFSLPKLRAMRHIVFGLGAAQVVVTLLVVMALVVLAGASPLTGFALGSVAALSSTAIVSKLLTERLELNAPHGQLSIGVLLFQDLAVVPLLILIPAFASHSTHLWQDLGLAALKVMGVMVLLFSIGQRVMRPWFHLVARQRSSELFMINVLLVTLGVSYLTELSGLSLALGAFVAGMLIAETEYRYQVEEDIKPFRDILLGFFFVTIGMRLDVSVLTEQFTLVLVFALFLVLGKALLMFAIARLFQYKSGESLRSAVALAQGGEFGFVLLALAGNLDLIAPQVEQSAIAAVLFSMLASPFLIPRSDWLVRKLIRADWMMQAADLHHILVSSMLRSEHVLICGYGRSGQALARLLERESIPVFALDLDPERVREAAAAGDAVVFGDAAKKEVLLAAGLMRAKALVITYSDTHSSIRILQVVQQLRPDLTVIVRTVDDSDIDLLREAGADEVVAEVMEGSLMLASQALMALGVPLNRVLRRIRSVREERYSLFRGFFRGVTDESLAMDDAQQARLAAVTLTPGSAAVGKTLGELHLGALCVQVRTVKRRSARHIAPDLDFELHADDVLVLLGTPEQIATAELLLLGGKH